MATLDAVQDDLKTLAEKRSMIEASLDDEKVREEYVFSTRTLIYVLTELCGRKAVRPLDSLCFCIFYIRAIHRFVATKLHDQELHRLVATKLYDQELHRFVAAKLYDQELHRFVASKLR